MLQYSSEEGLYYFAINIPLLIKFIYLSLNTVIIIV